MAVGAGLCMYDVVVKVHFAISSSDEFLLVEMKPKRDIGASQDRPGTETSRPSPHPCQ